MTAIELVMNGKSVGAELSKYLKGLSYREALDGEADTLEVTLQDVDGLFRSAWFPSRGMTIEATIYDEYTALPLGSFEIDEIENSFPPSECKIKGNSIPSTSGVKSVEKSRSWEQVPLSAIAADIASGGGLRLYYETSEDPLIERAEQSEESDLAFLHRLCKDKGLALKMNDRQLVIFDIEKYEGATATGAIVKGDSRLKRFSVRSTLNEVYSKCEVKYKSGRKGELIEGSYASGGILETMFGSSGRTLKVNKKVSTKAEADRLAKKSLKAKNREETKVQVTLVGDMSMRAGATILLAGFEVFDGKYLIQKATHTVGGSGYETALEMTRC